MSELAIKAEGLSKQYRLGQRERYKSLRDVLANPFRRAPKTETIWALKDVSFEIKRGEVVGIIGRNGAGKSTLLKILSQITEPTTGTADIYGRVGSLLEVGTGFHPELTGRENIFLNGAILGMRRHEIISKFDEIVAFAEVEKFIDTPVKHYSSGMHVRLAFAVAAHLEPEILLVDEVLAVGDAGFQRKCLGKMGEVAHEGRTVLLVSHQMWAIEDLCARAILLEDGTIHTMGHVSEAVHAYSLLVAETIQTTPLANRSNRQGTAEYRFEKVWLEDGAGKPAWGYRSGDAARVHALVVPRPEVGPVRCVTTLVINDRTGQRLMGLCGEYTCGEITLSEPTIITWNIPRLPLMEGEYLCHLFLGKLGGTDPIDFVPNAFSVNVTCGDYLGTGSAQISRIDKLMTDFTITCSPALSR